MVAIVIGEDLRHAVHLGERRIIGVQRQLYPGFRGHGEYGFHEIGVIRPDVLGRVLALERLLLDLGSEIVQVELARRVAPVLHVAGGVRVGGVEVVGCYRDFESTQISQKTMIYLDILVPPRLPQLDAKRTIGRVYHGEDTHTEPGKTLLCGPQIVETQLGLWKLQPDPREADLLQEK